MLINRIFAKTRYIMLARCEGSII